MSSKHENKRKIVVQTFLSLDGIMQAPDGPEEDLTDEQLA